MAVTRWPGCSSSTKAGTTTSTCPTRCAAAIAIHVSELWPFAQAMQRLESECFGCRLDDVGKEIKGSSLIDRKRFAFAAQGTPIPERDRREL